MTSLRLTGKQQFCLDGLSGVSWQLVVVGLYQMQRVPFLHKSIAYLEQRHVRSITDTVWLPNTYNFTRQGRTIDKHGKGRFGIWSLTTCMGRQIVGALGVQLHSDVWTVWQGKTSSFFTPPI